LNDYGGREISPPDETKLTMREIEKEGKKGRSCGGKVCHSARVGDEIRERERERERKRERLNARVRARGSGGNKMPDEIFI